jgi:hypothetical protein
MVEMRISGLPLPLFAAILLLSGCAGISSLWPSLTASDPAAPAAVSPPAAAPGTALVSAAGPPPLPPTLGTGDFEPRPASLGVPSDSFVGQRIEQLGRELAAVHARLSRHNAALQQARARSTETARRYHTAVVAVHAGLRAGDGAAATAERDRAAAALDALGGDIAALTGLANAVAAESATAAYIADAVRAAGELPGAVAEDHRQLAALAQDSERTVELIGRFTSELRQDIERESAYAGGERQRLAALSATINRGGAAVAGAPLGRAPRANGVATRPLVVIRFDRPDVQYEQAVYTAASRALERHPTAAFDLVAVTAAGGTPTQLAENTAATRRNAEAVLRSLTNMGLPADRITLSATTSVAAPSNEVHIYVR